MLKGCKKRNMQKSGRNEKLHGGRDLMRFVKSSTRTSHMKLRTAQSCLLLVAKNLNFAAFSCRHTKQVPSGQKQLGKLIYIDIQLTPISAVIPEYSPNRDIIKYL